MKNYKMLVVSFLLLIAGQWSTANVYYQPSTINDQLNPTNGQSPMANDLDRVAFYKAMRGNDKNEIKTQLTNLQSAPDDVRDAFIGAITMKQAGIGGDPSTKLSLFKKGHKMLEAAIKQEPNNAEFRFLRLMIQENAPGVLGYHYDITKDCEYIKKSYKSLPGDVQQAIVEYSKKSKNLKLEVS